MLTIDKLCSLFKRFLLEEVSHERYQHYSRNTDLLAHFKDMVSMGNLGQHIVYTDYSNRNLSMYSLANFFNFMYNQECIKNEIADMLDNFLVDIKLREMYLNGEGSYYPSTDTPRNIREYIESTNLHFLSPFSLIELGANYRSGKKIWMFANNEWREYFIKILKANEKRN